MGFQSLIGILVDWEEPLTPDSCFNHILQSVSIPDRDFSGLRGSAPLTITRLAFQSLIGILVDWEEIARFLRALEALSFQSLIGILVDWEYCCHKLQSSSPVSIPDRDFSGLRGDRKVPLELLPEKLLFQSLIGILVDWESSGFFPAVRAFSFQSLIGILVDWETALLMNWLRPLSFNPW